MLAPMAAFAQKFGHINSQALLESLPEAIKAFENELKAMQDELQRKAEDYDKNKSTMNATKQAETEQTLQDLYAKIQQAAQDNQQKFNQMQQEKLGPIIEKVRKAVEDVAKAGNYVYIMEQSAGQPIYVNTAISEDITAKVKAQLK